MKIHVNVEALVEEVLEMTHLLVVELLELVMEALEEETSVVVIMMVTKPKQTKYMDVTLLRTTFTALTTQFDTDSQRWSREPP